jgi:hypothetical protein
MLEMGFAATTRTEVLIRVVLPQERDHLDPLRNCEVSMPWQKPKRAWPRTRDTMIVASLFVLVGVTLWFLYTAFFPEWSSK